MTLLLLFASLFCLHPGAMFMDVCLRETEVVSSAPIYNRRGRWSNPCTLSFSSIHLKTLAGKGVDRGTGCLCELQARLCSHSKATTKSEIVLLLTLYLYQDLDKMVRLMFPCLKSLSNLAVCTEFDFPALTNISNDGIRPSIIYEPTRDTVLLCFLLLL